MNELGIGSSSAAVIEMTDSFICINDHVKPGDNTKKSPGST